MKIPVSPRIIKIKTALILLSITVLYIIYHYQGSSQFFMFFLNRSEVFGIAQARSCYYQWVMAFILLGLLPVLIIKIGFKERLSDYGLFIKKPVISLFITLSGIAVITPFIYFGAKRPDISSIYPLAKNAGYTPLLFLKSSLLYFLHYIGYEICFRGFLLMGIKDDIGDIQAAMVSLAATVLLHVTKPQSETVMALLAGIVFPLIVLKLRSIWPVILLHAYAGISLDYWIIINSGGF